MEQILSRGLHQADDESKSYTMHLMDKLEQVWYRRLKFEGSG